MQGIHVSAMKFFSLLRGERLGALLLVKVRRPAGGERIHVEWCLLKPSGVVGNKDERAETDLAALNQTSA